MDWTLFNGYGSLFPALEAVPRFSVENNSEWFISCLQRFFKSSDVLGG
jgi:hypothetical protein